MQYVFNKILHNKFEYYLSKKKEQKFALFLE